MAPLIKVAVADDHAIFRQGLISLLRLQDDIEVVAEIARAADLRSALQKNLSDVLILDLQMDTWVGSQIPELSKSTPVLVLTASERREDLIAALRAGARGVVQKRFAFEALVEAIRTIIEGGVFIPQSLQVDLTAVLSEKSPTQLSARESEIVQLVASGLRNYEVARRLSITEGTVKVHLYNIFQKLQIRDRVELTHYALRSGLVSLRPIPE